MYRGDVPGYVVLSDGTVFEGFGFGAQGIVLGEAVFNTSMSGYQEVVTDPSYHGQIVTFTYPLIGNYGVSDHLLESATVRSRAIVVREIKNTAWNQSCGTAWVDWLSERDVVGVGGIDTRALTRLLRWRVGRRWARRLMKRRRCSRRRYGLSIRQGRRWAPQRNSSTSWPTVTSNAGSWM